MLNSSASNNRAPGWLRSAILTTLFLLAIFGIWQAFVVPPCGRIIHAAAECPVGSTATFPNTLGIAGGTLFTMTISGVPTANGTYTIPDSFGNDTFGLLGTVGTWTADQTLEDNVNLTLGTGGDADIYYNGTSLRIQPDVVGTGDLVLYSADAGVSGPIFNIQHDSASPAVNDESMLRFIMDDSAGTADSMASIRGVLVDPTSGSEDTALDFYTRAAGTAAVSHLRIGNNGVLSIRTNLAPTAGNSGIVFADQTAFSGMPSNTAGIYADDVAGTVELFAIDEAGNATQISPHPTMFLNSLPIDCDLPWAFQSTNPYVGKAISVDLCGALMALETLTGQTFITVQDLPPSERRNWADDQQVNFDRCIASGGQQGVDCVKKPPPQWMIDRGVPALR